MYDVVIIGAGIGGCTAGIYAARKRMDHVVLSKNFGGQFMSSGEVLNYPGIQQTTGAGFAQIMKKQVEFNKVNLNSSEEVKKIENTGDSFKVITGKRQYETRSIIIATGARPRKLGVTGEEKFDKKGVTYCAICDGPLFSGRDVAVIGGGDAALEAVDFLKDIANKIYIINLTDELKAHEYLQERLKKNPKVELINNAATKEILGDKFVSGLKYEQNGKEKTIDVQGVFVEIGRVPNTEFIKGAVELDKTGHIAVKNSVETSVPGIFAAGDCTSVGEYQYVIAAGNACFALLKAAKYLASKK